MDTLILTKFILGFTLAGDAGLLFFLLRKERSVNKLFFAIFLVGITGWTAAIFANLWVHSYIVEEYVFAFAALFLTAQVLFTQFFPNKLPRTLYSYWSVVVGSFFLVTSFWSGATFSSLTFDPSGYTIVENGFLSGYYSLFALAFVAAPVLFLARTLRRTTNPSLRLQLKHLIAGFSIFLGVNIFTNSILPVFFHIFFFNAIGPVFSLFLAAFVFYIIWRYNFLEIRLVLERGLMYGVLLILLIESYFNLLPFFEQSDLPDEVIGLCIALLLLLIGVFVVYTIERYFQNKELLEKERIYARQLEDKVLERTAHIESMRAKERQLMQDISHAQQTSLTILKANVELLKQQDPQGKEPTLSAMEQGIERSSLLMYDLLRVAHLEMQEKKTYVSVDVSALVRKVAEYVEIVCDANSMSLVSHIEPHIVVTGDEKQLEEVLLILLSNAVKYRKPGTSGTITLSLTRHSDTALISIADDGIGIAAEYLPHLFKRFYRANTVSDGNGLGLAIAHAIVQAHGGSISVQSIEGQGSTFIMQLSTKK